MENIHNLIAAIRPEVYCVPEKRGEVKEIVKEKGYLAAAKVAKPIKAEPASFDILKTGSPLDAPGLKAPIEEHSLVYDSSAEGLEPVYFWILDFMNSAYKKTTKLVDNFISSPGGGHFAEIGQRATVMQNEAMKAMGAINQVIKSILNLIYDLKEFKMRLTIYDALKSKEESEKSAAKLSLKQIWLDTVDFKRGNTSIKGLTLGGQSYFVTLIDAFMVAENAKSAEKMDLNDRVKRILEQRIEEFNSWIKLSEGELKKRFEIEKSYLKSQVNTVKLYTRWVKPYLKAARALEQRAEPTAGLVTAFNSIVFELKLLGESPYEPAEDVATGDLPKSFKNATDRTYSSVVIVEFNFRGIPQRVGQHYSFGGRTEVKFTSYALNNEELEVLKNEIEKDDFGDVVKWAEGATTESLEQMEDDLIEFEAIEGKKKDEEKKEEGGENPFSALFSFLSFQKKKEKKDLSKGVKQDSGHERIIRSQAIIAAREKCFNLFDVYKKAHNMPSHVNPYDKVF